ncbi:tetratricopeptide repeat protein [Algoriphagus sp. D3-2-R+10]|uniref:tetratricopeptide repeat protein n=1 Tax=Algoriphagus aurantiacus TaxID=3103948 RepID=UPI002B378E8A|nr:tetratricopeptide repeat protein [Algoriphagus sp. D3-2-R+10]MEB2777361.1 tetratricopeptide repeat protein [Algoriphagus sp. D3-2-R+10]
MRSTFKLTLIFLFSLAIWTDIHAQNEYIDSLKTELKNHQKKDSTLALLYYKLAFSHFQSDQETTLTYLIKAEKLSDSLAYAGGKARTLYLRGILESIKSNYPESLEYFERSMKHYEQINDQDGIASILTAFGITHMSLSQYDQAINAYKKAAEIYQKTGNERELITTLINSANVYSETGRYKEAIANFEEALYRSKASQDHSGVASVHANMGVIHQTQGNYPLALENFNKGLEYQRETKDSLGMAFMLFNLGDTYELLKKNDKAIEYFQQSMAFAQQMEIKNLIALNNSSLGNIYVRKNEFEKALIYYRIAQKTNQETGNIKQMAMNLVYLGEVYLSLNNPIQARENFLKAKEIAEETSLKSIMATSLSGLAETFLKENDYQKALTYSEKAKVIADELGLLEAQRTSSEQLSEIFENTGQYQKALEYHKQFKAFNDSLFNKENIEKITQLEYEYKYKQALDSANIRELKLTKTVLDTSQDLAKTRQNYLWAVIGILLVSLGLGIVIFYQKLKNEKTKTATIIVEQKLLRSQMTPHFIFNSLSVLQGMILNKEEQKSISYLSKFSRLLRIILENSRDKMVLLSNEIIAVENYLALHNLEDHQFQYSITVDEQIDQSSIGIPPMLIQPFVENAIEHAFTELHEERKIEIHLGFMNEKLICTIADNGIGIDSQKKPNENGKKSLATTITRERLKILSKDFNMKGQVSIEDRSKYQEEGTIVTLTIPYKQNQEA